MKYIKESFDYVLQEYPKAFHKTPRVDIRTWFSRHELGYETLRLKVLFTMIALAERAPTVSSRFRDGMWRLLPQWKSDPSLVPSFLEAGRDLKAALTEAGYYKKPQNGKLHPWTPRYEKSKAALMQRLDEATGKEVLDWFENGI
ncbi:hypothetical protein E8E11_008170 [Didymella keratinophila]|nr:hypothetical protein E8E11_008170 [Didymella keratinophila]